VWLEFRVVAVPLSPKVHDHAVGELVEVSVKATVRGTVPLRGEPVKTATGAEGIGAATVM
jgi:hypothetical protein